MNAAIHPTPIRRVTGSEARVVSDRLAVEEPLEIRLEHGPVAARVRKSISITMRTPGHDEELAAGFLFTEGLIQSREQIRWLGPCGTGGNTVRVELAPDLPLDLARLERHFYTSSSCGVCGKKSIEALRTQSRFGVTSGEPRLAASVIHALPAALRRAQAVFDSTGGLHASALFTPRGELTILREDVGRHNALDKVVGRAFLDGTLPLRERSLLVSGRASFELVQKAAMAGIPVFAAVGAPSSLAVELARESGLTLLGFVRDQRFNIYSGDERIDL